MGAADGHACVSATKLHNCWNVQAMQIQRQIHVIHTYRNTVTNACRISMQIQISLSAWAKLRRDDYKPFANVLLFFRLKWFRPWWWIITGVRLQSKAGGEGSPFWRSKYSEILALWLAHGEFNVHVKILAPHFNYFRVDEASVHRNTCHVLHGNLKYARKSLQTVFWDPQFP